MKARKGLGAIVMMFVLVLSVQAQAQGGIQKYFNDASGKVKATTDPAQKREILDKSLQAMSKALDKAERMGLVSQEDRAGINRFKVSLQEKQNELTGTNGYDRVTDAQLNAFTDYVVQDMEQAEKTITISLVAALLIVIILILIL